MERIHYSFYKMPKAVLALLAMLVIVSSCSSPKYTASFTNAPAAKLAQAKAPEAEPLVEGVELAVVMEETAINEETPEILTASIAENSVADAKAAKLAMLNEVIEKVKANPEATAPKKMNLAEKMAIKRVAKKLDNMMKEKGLNESKNIDSINQSARSGGWGGLITGILLVLAGIVLQAILPAGVVIIGTIVWIAGVVALILWLLRFLGVI